MSRARALAALVWLTAAGLAAQAREPSLEAEIRTLDAHASDPDRKVLMVQWMADDLGVHRNHLFRLRRETGQSFGRIYVSALELRGEPPARVLEKARDLDRRLSESGDAAIRPLAYISAGAGHAPGGAFYSLAPEIGVRFRHSSLVFGLPYYRFDGSPRVSGIGDAYATASIYGGWRSMDLTLAATVFFPTGDESRALGAGKTTADVSGTVAKRIRAIKPFFSAGFATSTFNNAGYQRLYVADGNAIHVSGGLDVQPWRRLTTGAGMFALRPLGAQTVYARGTAAPPVGSPAAGHMSGGMGRTPGSVGITQPATRSAAELRDYGASIWSSFRISPAVSVQLSVARSVPFHLTIFRAGIGIDLWAWLTDLQRHGR